MYSELTDLGNRRTREAQSDERQRFADLAAIQQRSDTANQRRILAQAPEANFGLPQGYQFGQQNGSTSPTPGGAPQGPAGSSPGPQATITPTPGAWRGRDSTGRNDPRTTQAFRDKTDLMRGPAALYDIAQAPAAGLLNLVSAGVTGASNVGSRVSNAMGITDNAPTNRVAPQWSATPAYDQIRLRDAQSGMPPDQLAKLREQEVNRNTQAIRANQSKSAPAGAAPLSVRNNNPGNLKFAGQPGATADARGFAVFQTPEAGAAAADNQLNLYMQRDGLNTVRGIVNKWSPVADPGNAAGSTANYANYVAKQLGISPDQPLSPQDIPRLRAAMAQFEAGTGAGAAPQAQGGQPAAPQQYQQPAADYSGMGPGGAPQMAQEQLQLAQFRYKQLAEMLPHMPPEQQWKVQGEMDTIYTGARAKQAYMLAQQSDSRPEALAQLVAISGAQAARTQDGRYVLVDQSGRPLSQPVTGGQLGAYLFHAMDEKSRAAQAEMQGKIALEEAKQRAIAQGKLTEQGGTGAELESLKSLLEQERNRNKPPEYSFLSPVTGGVYAGNKATGAITPYTQLDAVPLPR